MSSEEPNGPERVFLNLAQGALAQLKPIAGVLADAAPTGMLFCDGALNDANGRTFLVLIATNDTANALLAEVKRLGEAQVSACLQAGRTPIVRGLDPGGAAAAAAARGKSKLN